jgi:hypothetical protein
MADKFCIHCGSPLMGARKFCANCGKSVGDETSAKNALPVPDGQIFERLTGKIQMPVHIPKLSGLELPQMAPLRPPSLGIVSPSPQQSKAGDTPAADQVRFDRVPEPNQNAFTVLVPRGWKIRGGIFDVNPLQVDGTGNSMSPKCDFAVMSDDQGTMMMRWIPSWNFADSAYSPSGGAPSQPGQWYQGMPVRPMVSARQFLWELLQAERPRATGMTIDKEEAVHEITAAFYKQAEPLNRGLQQAGLPTWNFESWDMRVEYTEDGQLFWEEVIATIGDYRRGGNMWMNDCTFMLRAPAPLYPTWGRVLEEIRQSPEYNQQWLAAVEKAKGERARMAWETQQYANQVMAEIMAKRQQAWDEAQKKREEPW